MAEWNGLDFILTAVVVISVATAAVKGFVHELISLASVVVGLIVAAAGYRRAAGWFEELTRSREVALGVAFLTLFVGALIVGVIVSAIARKLIKKGELQRADFFLGAVFGLARGVLVDCVLLMSLVAFAIKPQTVQQSVLAPYVTTGARVVALAMPKDLRDQFQTGFEKLKQAILPEDKKALKN